jgi:hypothetical protein
MVATMPTSKLLEKLLEIERSLGHADHLSIRAMVMDAQVEALRVQADVIQVLEDMTVLREQQERLPAAVSARAEKPPRSALGFARLRARTA